MLYTTMLLNGIIDYLILNKSRLVYNNLLLATYIKSVIIIPLYLLLFMPIYLLIGDNFMIAIIVMIISIFIVTDIGVRIIDTYKIKNQKVIAIILIAITYGIFGILTYYPLNNILFKVN